MSDQEFAIFKKEEFEMAAQMGVLDDILDQLEMTESGEQNYTFILCLGVALECTEDVSYIHLKSRIFKLDKKTSTMIWNYCLENSK